MSSGVAAFFPPSPWAYNWLLHVFQWGPVFTVTMWLSDYHPCGKFSREKGFNLNGRFAWALMESVGPAHMLYVLWSSYQRFPIVELPLWNKLAASLYILHYINRAWIGPLFVAPSMSPVGLEIFTAVSLHNWFNTAILAPWIAGYRTEILDVPGLSTILPPNALAGYAQAVPYLGVVVFALGMTNNILAERRLWRMRKEEALSRARKTNSAQGRGSSSDNIYYKVYVMPPADGLFRYSLYPHYFWEWVEWFGFVLVGTGVTCTLPASSAALMQTPPIQLAPWILPFAYLARMVGTPLPLAPLAYVLNFVACMPPQARRGLRWYKEKFGEAAVAGRSAIVPGIPWM